MHPRGNSHAEHQLEQLAHRFDHWRQSRTSRAEPIPQTLWEQAASLTTVLSRSRVARQLRISGSDLKKRCAALHAAPSAADSPPVSLDFVELPSAPLAWSIPSLSAEVELYRADGTRMRIAYREPHPPLAALVRTFLEMT